jgi:glycosyltransferase involved in cell wall biosynthesis
LAAFVGGIGYDSNKGLDTLIHAWSALCSRADWDVDLIVAGGGRAVARWKNQIERAGLLDRIQIIGFTERVADVLAAADVLVSPVRYEAYGLNVHEALCSDVPAIVSASAGIAERYPIELSDLILRDPEDVDELIRLLLAWRLRLEWWKETVKPFGAELRRRSWMDMARDFVTLAENSKIVATS